MIHRTGDLVQSFSINLPLIMWSIQTDRTEVTVDWTSNGSGGSRISQREGGCANLLFDQFSPIFSQKLHENEGILGERVGRVPGAPLRSATQWDQFVKPSLTADQVIRLLAELNMSLRSVFCSATVNDPCKTTIDMCPRYFWHLILDAQKTYPGIVNFTLLKFALQSILIVPLLVVC